MGMKIIETNETVNLSQYGLKAGDAITVICVGGGAGGSNAVNFSNTYSTYYHTGGAAGEGGSGSNYAGGGAAGAGYGAGGGGAAGGYNQTGGNGGGAGKVNIKTIILNETTVNNLTATIGAGGAAGLNGEASSLGSLITAAGGIIGKGGQGGQMFNAELYAPGGGGEGGFLLTQKIWGGQGGSAGMTYYYNRTINSNAGAVADFTFVQYPELQGCGGGAGGYFGGTHLKSPMIFGQTSQYGGKGGEPKTAGGKGVCSKGSGVIVIMW